MNDLVFSRDEWRILHLFRLLNENGRILAIQNIKDMAAIGALSNIKKDKEIKTK